jgi:predicted nucleic acid-binding protein
MNTSVSAGRLRVPAVAFHELWRGAADGEERGRLRRLLRGAPVLVLTRQDVEAAADVWRRLDARLRDASEDRDLLIGSALARGWPLLTRTREHFAPTGVELHREGGA